MLLNKIPFTLQYSAQDAEYRLNLHTFFLKDVEDKNVCHIISSKVFFLWTLFYKKTK